jgi:peptidoglycan/xylan/chitin deacetylase (PgdA/CDA1 family)
MAAHHRRRRAVAGLTFLGAALVVTVLVVGGSGLTPAAHMRAGGFLARVQTPAGHGAGSPAARRRAAENKAINRTLAYTPWVRIAGAQHREIALTFDDGPGPYTPEIVSVLEREKVPATFFEVGVLERWF